MEIKHEELGDLPLLSHIIAQSGNYYLCPLSQSYYSILCTQ